MRQRVRLLVFSVFLSGVLIACGQDSSERTSTVPGTAQPSKVSVRMKWFFAGTMAGWFAAREEGFFKEAGLDVSIQPGGPDNSSVKLVAAGSDLFGVAGADEVLMGREKGIPIVAVAVLFKESPVVFIAKKGRGITSPRHWSGKAVEVVHGGNAEIVYRALVKKYSVERIKEVPYTFNLAPFIQGKVDVSVAYKMDQVVTLERQGIRLDIVDPKDHGINPYGDVIITTEQTVKEKKDLVKRFVQAALRGFTWSIDHAPDAIRHLTKNAPELKSENEAQVFAATIPFLLGQGKKTEIGIMDRQRWEETMRVLLDFGALKKPVPVQEAFVNVLREE